MRCGEQDLLVATGVDGADVLEAEIPLQIRFHKGGHEATAGSIHVNLHVIALYASQMMNCVHWGQFMHIIC